MSRAPSRSLIHAVKPDVRGGMGIFFTGGAIAVVLIGALLFFGLLFGRGAAAFWVRPLVEWTMADGSVHLVEELDVYEDGEIRAHLGNRDHNPGRVDHLRARPEAIASRRLPEDAVRIERTEYGPFHGYLDEITEEGYAVRLPDGTALTLDQEAVLRVTHPNRLDFLERLGAWFANTWRFLSENPRESNTEGGVWPALVGTSVLVIFMSILVVPFGVLAAVYLNEYARDTWFVRLVRIAVNNLAGVPSIVYGVFGLGFLVYGVGSGLDALFYADELPKPTFGKGGLLWAAITMALLTVPVVVVATEEALRAVPTARREGALALGATRLEVLRTIILPGAKPGILTGLILAVSRAAGEVAPLMLTGVIATAHELPVDGEAPFVHPSRPFMHLGYHIYIVGFQVPNVEAAEPYVYATASLLLFLVVGLNLVAIRIRSNVRKRLTGS